MKHMKPNAILRAASALPIVALALVCFVPGQAAHAAQADEGGATVGMLTTQADSSWSVNGEVSYSLSGDTLTLAPSDGASGDIVIAPKVTCAEKFDGGAFMGWEYFYNDPSATAPPWYKYHDSIKKVVIKPGITSIGNCAFAELENLDEVSIPSTVTTIGKNAFTGCKVTNITLPEGVKYIGSWAFWGCEFKSITFPKSLKLLCHWICSPIDGGVETIEFLGDAPEIPLMNIPFDEGFITATAYYPANNSTWTAEVRESIGGGLRWRARNADGSVQKVPLSSCDISLSTTSLVYTGGALEPSVQIAEKSTPLVAGKDFKVSYADNVNAGTAAKVIVTGMGEYTGTVTKPFTIAKAANPFKLKGKTVTVKAKKLKKSSVKVAAKNAIVVSSAKGTCTFKKVSGNKKITVSKTGKVTVKKGTKKGTYKVTVKVTASGNSSYMAKTKKVTFKVKVK